MRTLVLGAAASGIAAARLARRLGHAVSIYDERAEVTVPMMAEGFGIFTGAWDPTTLDGVSLVVASPGFPERSRPITETLESRIPLISELEFGWRELGVPTVAVTGTNGKTTVTGLVSEMLTASGRVAPALGNIGDAVSAAVGTGVEQAVIEASSFQLRFIDRFHAEVAVVTNVAPDHLDWHGTFDAYLAAKLRIVEHQGPDDVLIYDVDDEGAARLASRAPGRLLEVSGSRAPRSGYGPDRRRGVLALGPVEIGLDEIGVDTPAFLADLAAAAAAAIEAGADPEAVAAVVRRFQPGAHRRTVVGSRLGITFIDDSKASNPHAAIASVRSYPSVVLIAGGRAKGLDVRPLAAEPSVKAVVAIGEASAALLEAAGDRGIAATDMDEAVRLAFERASAGDVVLLAPGCASWDMFESYAHRGAAFAEAAQAVIRGESTSA